MRIRRKKNSMIVSLLLMCMMLCMAAAPVYAHDVPDLNRSGSVSITMHSGDEAVAGGSLICYRAGDVSENKGIYEFRLSVDFADSRVSLDDISDSDTALKLSQWAEKEIIEGTVQKIDGSGHVVFSDLKPGLYLMVQDEAADGYYKAVPFLVSVPMNENGIYIYDVEASPKVELEKKPEPGTPENPETPVTPVTPTEPTAPTEPVKPHEPTLPQTGQLNWPVPVMCISGLVLLAIGFLLRNSKKKIENAN